MLYLIALLPPILFILALLWMDSFSLVKKWVLAWSFIMGSLAVALAYATITGIVKLSFSADISGPIVEECFKALGIVLLVRLRRCAFFIDAAIYGAAIGAGFSFVENIVYVYLNTDMMVGTAIVRGLGTAIMHCGCVISTAVILSWLANQKRIAHYFYPLAVAPAIILHLLYNTLHLAPMLLLLVTIVGIVTWTFLLFTYNEKLISRWMEDEMYAEVKMISAMKKGKFSDSKAGQYMMSIKEQFSSECFLDMFCYVRLYYELSLESKTNMIRAEAGLPIQKNEETSAKVAEFNTLKHQIGKTAQIAISPIVHPSRLTDWKIGSMS